MKFLWGLIASFSTLAFAADAPRFTPNSELMRPDNYREWIYLSSGLGMTYGPAAQGIPSFDNVFVTREAYKSFLESGRWPDKTMFILEIRAALSKGSINQGGNFQGNVVAIEAAVKDEARFPDKWGSFQFDRGANTSKVLPKTASCYACHSTNGAVENTFTQFYPTALEVAMAKGTVRQSYLAAAVKEEQIIDPVCNMPVDPKVALKLEHDGKTTYFCRQECKDQFEKEQKAKLKSANSN